MDKIDSTSYIRITEKEGVDILCGDCLYDYFINQEIDKLNPNITVFREAMVYGDKTYDIFSEEFIKARCYALDINNKHYINNTVNEIRRLPLQVTDNIRLWYGTDAFCIVNMVTLLAYLESQCYKGNVSIVFINEAEYTVKDIVSVKLGIYREVYGNVIVNGKDILIEYNDNLSPYIVNGLRLYLNLLKNDNDITDYIKSHSGMGDEELIGKLIAEFTDYGLGDLQYIKIIERVRKEMENDRKRKDG